MESLKRRLGKRIASLRQSASLTQEQLAEKAGYSVDFIGLVERGVNAPAVEGLEEFADALGVEVVELFDFNDRLQKPKLHRLKH